MTNIRGIQFGFLPERESYAGSHWSVAPLPNIDEVIEEVLADECCSGKWFFQPIGPDQREPTARSRPLAPVLKYYLPSTHRIEYDTSRYDDDGLVFLLFTLGFAKGLFLVQEGWGHVFSTPVKIGHLSGFYCRPRAVVEMIDKFESLANNHADGPKEGQNAISGVLCWYMFSQSYRLTFEEFLGQYTVMDSLCRLYDKTHAQKLPVQHSRKPEALCSALGVDPPSWVQTRPDPLSGKTISDLSKIRNALVHEGKFGEKPALLGTPDLDTLEEIWWFHELNRSLILALIDFSPGSDPEPVWKDPIWGQYYGFD